MTLLAGEGSAGPPPGIAIGGKSGSTKDCFQHKRGRLIDRALIFVATYGRGSTNQAIAGSEYFGVAQNHGAKVFGFRQNSSSGRRPKVPPQT